VNFRSDCSQHSGSGLTRLAAKGQEWIDSKARRRCDTAELAEADVTPGGPAENDPALPIRAKSAA